MIDIRHTKLLRDLWLNKSRTLLVVLSISVGVAAFGLMITGRIVLEQNLTDEYARSHPAQSVLSVSPFDDDLLETVRRQPAVQNAEGRHVMQANLQLDANQWVSMEIHGIPNFGEITINRIKP